MWSKTGIVLLVIIVLLCVFNCLGDDILNPGFEFYTPVGDINEPNDWESYNFVSVMQEFTPHPEQGQDPWMNWKIDYPLLPHDGNSFVVLSTGDIKPEPGEAAMWQTVDFTTGQKLSGWYFFGTCDYLQWNDWATISLVAADGYVRTILLVSIDVATVGNYSSTNGWQYFEHIFSPIEEGTYQLKFFVSDYGDAIFKTYLAADDLHLCLAREYGDLNQDCKIDFLDFAVLAAYWQEFCSDPNSCENADVDRSGFIDFNDLSVITENWLLGL
ncbi:MAG: dockerin type I domain-containing protein [Planctomycetota bacterium]